MYEAKNKQFDKLRAGYKKYITDVFHAARHEGRENPPPAVYGLEEKIGRPSGPGSRTAIRRRPTTS